MQARSRGPFSIGRWTWSCVERRLFNGHYCSQLSVPQKKKEKKKSDDCRSIVDQQLSNHRQVTDSRQIGWNIANTSKKS